MFCSTELKSFNTYVQLGKNGLYHNKLTWIIPFQVMKLINPYLDMHYIKGRISLVQESFYKFPVPHPKRS